MKHESKQNSKEQEQLAAAQTQSTAAREFASTEELLQHDAAQITVPPAVAERLNNSIQQLPKPATSWWRRLLEG